MSEQPAEARARRARQAARALALVSADQRHRAIAAATTGDHVEAVQALDLESNRGLVLRAPYFVDATEMGDLLPLTKTEYAIGAEAGSETGEPHAKAQAEPDNLQGFTFCFAMDWRVLGILLGLYLLYYVFCLRPAIKSLELALAVLFYLLISCVAFSAAWGMRMRPLLKWPFIAGIGLIVFSDTLISFNEFLRWKQWNWLILPTYYLAQLCVSWTVLAQNPGEALPGTGGAADG